MEQHLLKLRVPNQPYSTPPLLKVTEPVIDTSSHRAINKLLGSILGEYQKQQWISFKENLKIDKIVYVDIEVEQSKFQWMIKEKMLEFMGEIQDGERVTFKDQNVNQYYFQELTGYNIREERRIDKQLSYNHNLYNRYRSFRLQEYQLRDNKYPSIESSPDYKVFSMPTPTSKQLKIQEKILCLDCQMVITTQGFQLARISIINYNFQVIMDELVKPNNKIVNYNTKFSGITEELLEKVDTTLSDIQQRLENIITPDVVLIGHSLENDLRCLKIVHSNVVDTAVIFQHNGRKQQLKQLVFNYLKMTVQRSSHDSVEDCKSTLALAKLHVEILTQFQNQEKYSHCNLIQELVKTGKRISIEGKDDSQLVELGDKLYHLIKEQRGTEGGSSEIHNNLVCFQFRPKEEDVSWEEYYHFVDKELQQIYTAASKDTLIIYNFQVRKNYVELVLQFSYSPMKPHAIFQVKNDI